MSEQSTDVVESPQDSDNLQIKMPDYILRMRDDVQALTEKTDNLARFLGSDEANHVDETDRVLMVQQMFSMRGYLFFLEQRFQLAMQKIIRQAQEG